MNKSNLIDSIASVSNLSKKDATLAIDSFIEVVSEALKAGEEIKIPNFGTFTITHRKAKMGRNPRTGEAIKIAASKTPKFKPLKKLKEFIS